MPTDCFSGGFPVVISYASYTHTPSLCCVNTADVSASTRRGEEGTATLKKQTHAIREIQNICDLKCAATVAAGGECNVPYKMNGTSSASQHKNKSNQPNRHHRKAAHQMGKFIKYTKNIKKQKEDHLLIVGKN